MTLDHLDKKHEGSLLFQCVAAISGTVNVICGGMNYGWPSPSLPKLHNEDSPISVTATEESWIPVMTLLGALCGAIIGVFLSNTIGRKKVILVACFPFFAAWIMIAFANSAGLIIGGRFISGVSDGMVMNALPMYIGEISDPRIRGVLGSSVGVLWIFGILLMNVIGSYLSIKMAAVVSSVVPILCLLTFMWMPESPYFLIMKKNVEQARKNLMILKRSKDVEAELHRIMRAAKDQEENAGKLWDLFTIKSNRKALFITMGIRSAQQLSGMMAIIFYAQTIFEEAGNSDIISSSNAAIIYFSVQLILCVLCSMIVDKAGRKPLLIVSIVGASVALFVEGSYFLALNKLNVNSFTWIPLVGLIFYVISFSLGMQTLPMLLLGELFPTNIKAFALCVGDIHFIIVGTIASKFFQITKDEFGLHVPFYVFCVCCIIGLVFIIFFVFETKGKTLEEIQDELRGSSGSKDVEISEKSIMSREA